VDHEYPIKYPQYISMPYHIYMVVNLHFCRITPLICLVNPQKYQIYLV
jgi:hypothetical protein